MGHVLVFCSVNHFMKRRPWWRDRVAWIRETIYGVWMWVMLGCGGKALCEEGER